MNIGLIAMSGIRAHNEELTQLGLTLPGFVDRNRIVASMPSLSLLTLAALTPSQHSCDYREIADLKQLPALPLDYDLVAITTFSAQAFESYDVADYYRAHGVAVVMGGLHVTSVPQEAKQHCDAVVIGEGEPVWQDVLRDFERGALKEYYQSSVDYPMEDAPIPRFDLLDPDKYNRLTIQTSRGCPHKCEFCASSILLTRKYKVKPVRKMIDELHAIKDVWARPFIEFADDNTFVKKQHYKELLHALVPENIRWFTEADLSVAEDDEMLGLMRDSGCQQILIGLESISPTSLDAIELNSNWKRKRLDLYKKAITKIQSYGITVNGCFILGLDGDGPDVFDHVVEFVKESGLYEVQVTFLTPFPNTPLYRRLEQEDRLIKKEAWELCTLFDINIIPKNMTVAELQSGFLELVHQLYSGEATNARRSNFRHMLRTSPNFGWRAAQAA